MLLPFIILGHLQSLKQISQVPINFHTKLGKIELHITLDRVMISTLTLHQLLVITNGNYTRHYFD